MPSRAHRPPSLQGWTVLSLRPQGQHAGMRDAAARLGARALALSPYAIRNRDDATARDALARALQADLVIHTSPNAVRAAAALQSLGSAAAPAIAVGDTTRRTLRGHGVEATAPLRMDSEGVLAMAPLQAIRGRRIGVVTGAGGRDQLAPALRERGAEVIRADVYERVAVALTPASLARLQAVLGEPSRVVLAVGSAEALRLVLGQLPDAMRARFCAVPVAAASARLADVVRGAGFRRVAVATDARPASLLRAAADAFA